MQKLLILLGIVVIVGAGAHLYLKKMDEKAGYPTVIPPTTEVTEEPEVADEELTEPESTAPTASAPAVETTPAPAVVSEAEVDATLSALEGLFDEEYDDSSVDGDFEDNLDQSYGF